MLMLSGYNLNEMKKLFIALVALLGTEGYLFSCDEPCTPVINNLTSLSACSAGNSYYSEVRISDYCNTDFFQYEASDPNAVYDVDYGVVGGVYKATIYWNDQFVGTTTIKFRGVHDCALSNKTGDWSNEITFDITHNPTQKNLTITGVGNVCPGSSGDYSIPAQDRATSYRWIFTDPTFNIMDPTSTVGVLNVGAAEGTTNDETVNFYTSLANVTTDVWLRVIAENRCGSKPVAKLQIIAKPLVSTPNSPTSSSTACVTTNTVFSITAIANATSYEWNINNTNAGSFTPSNITTTPSVTMDWNDSYLGGTVYCKVRAINSCGNSNWSSTKTVTVTGVPGTCATPTGSSTACKGAQDVAFITTGATNATTYTWEISPSAAGTISGTSKTGYVDFSSTYTGAATIRARGVSCTSGTWSGSFTVNICPNLAKPQTPTGMDEICQDYMNNSYSVTSVANATFYQWELLPAEAGLTTATGTLLTVNWASDFVGTATIRVRGVNTCETGPWSDYLTISVSPYPEDAEIPFGETSICQGTVSTSYSLSSLINNAETYQWELLPAGAGTVSGSGTIISVMWNASFSGSATLRVRGENECGEGPWSNFLQIIINPLPSKPSTPVGLTTVCEGSSSIQYNTFGASFATGYEWILSPTEAGYLIPNGSYCGINFASSYTGQAELKVRGMSCGYGPFSDVITINVIKVLDQPSMPIGDESLCQDASNTTYEASIQVDATSYEWNIVPGQAGSLIDNADGSEVQINWNSIFAGSAELYVRSYNYCGYSSWSDPLEIIVSELPSASSTPSSVSQLCSADEATLSVNPIAYSDYYSWNITPLVYEFISDSSLNEVTIKVNDSYTGLVYYRVAGINECGAGAESNSNYFTVFESPTQPDFTLDPSYCFGSIVDISVTNNSANNTPNWYNNGGLFYSGNTISFPSADYRNNLFVQYYNPSNNCGSEMKKVDLNVLEEVIADFSSPVTSIDIGASVTLINESSENATTYLWYFGDGLSSETESPVHNYYNRGNYDVTLIAYDENSCSDTLSKTGYIIVGGETSIDNITKLGIKLYPIPAGDLFYIDTKECQGENDIQAEIYNTLGQSLITEKLSTGETNQIDISLLKEGIYLLKLTINGIEGTEKFIKE